MWQSIHNLWTSITDKLIGEQAYLKQLQRHPLRTKMLTSGALQAGQEYLASYLTGMKNANGGYFTDRTIKMSIYGIFVQAPLSHVLVLKLQKLFAGRTGFKAKALQILCSNLTVSSSLLLESTAGADSSIIRSFQFKTSHYWSARLLLGVLRPSHRSKRPWKPDSYLCTSLARYSRHCAWCLHRLSFHRICGCRSSTLWHSA